MSNEPRRDGVHLVPYFRTHHVWIIGAVTGLLAAVVAGLLESWRNGLGYLFYPLFPLLFWLALRQVKTWKVRACATCDHFVGKRTSVCGACGADLHRPTA